MRFGAFIPQGWRLDLVGIEPVNQWQVMRDLAQRLDGIDAWESLWVYDHFHTTPEPTQEATHEAWTLMSAFAASTDRIRLGQMCTCMSYRNPAYLAKVAATVDAISGGRVEMGIGAGWYEHEWRAYGYGFPRAGERLERLREGVEIFRQLWTTGSATLDGKHYQVDGALGWPRPLQGTAVEGSPRNGIPLWVAGGGEKKTLRIAAEYADYANYFGDPEQFRHKSAVLDAHCRDIGRDPAEIVRSGNVNVFLSDTDSGVAQRLTALQERYRAGGLSAENVEAVQQQRGSAGAGTPEQVIARLRELKDAGLSYLIVNFPEAAYDTSGMELFEREVMPALRD